MSCSCGRPWQWTPSLNAVAEYPNRITHNHAGLEKRDGSQPYDQVRVYLSSEEILDSTGGPFPKRVDPSLSRKDRSLTEHAGPHPPISSGRQCDSGMEDPSCLETELYDGCTGTSCRNCRIQQGKSTTASTSIMTTATMSILIIIVIVVSTFVSISVVTLFRPGHSHLVDRVSSLEKALSELSASCNVHCGPERGQDRNNESGERRNKFAFLITQNALPGMSSNDLGNPIEGTGDSDVVMSSSRTHPILKTSTIYSSGKMSGNESKPNAHVQDEDSSNLTSSLPISENSTGEEQVDKPVARRALRDEETSKRKRQAGGRRNKQKSDERARVSTPTRNTSTPASGFHRVRGVHFQSNLNRTATIGVGEAGWMPHWALSTSLDADPEIRAQVLRKFMLSPRGNVTVLDAGFYYIYSQMMYYDQNDYIGHSIAINGVEAFTCIAPVTHRTNKYKTCYIGGLAYLSKRAKVGIKMTYTPRQISMFEDTCYFGMFRVT